MWKTIEILLLVSVSGFYKFVGMRDFFYLLLVYAIFTKQTSCRITLCSSDIESDTDLSNYDSDLKQAVQACIQNIELCTNGNIALPSSTPTPQTMTSDSTNHMTTQAMSTPSKTIGGHKSVNR